MTPWRDLATIIRPANSILVGFAVIVGVAVASPSSIIRTSSLFGFLTGFFISAYSMTINDHYDVDSDRINAPWRPMAAGRISPRLGLTYAAILVSLGLISSALISIENLIIATVFALVAWLYSSKGKRFGLLGNCMVALSVAIPYVYGGMAVKELTDPLLLFLTSTSFFAALGREVAKTILDTEGDRSVGVKSVTIVRGEKFAASSASIFFLLAVASSILPFMLRLIGFTYLLLIAPAASIFMFSALSILRDYSKSNAIRVKRLTLFGMLLGLLAFIAASNL